MKKWIGCGVVALVLGVIGLAVLSWVWSGYNRIVAADVKVGAAWANVESAYQRRMDLIPNLVETVKGAAAFERSTLEAVVQARARASQIVLTPEILGDADRFREFQEAQGQLTGALSRLLATVEAYPDLKTSRNFLELQSQIEGTENRINVERRRLNEAVAAYAMTIRTFPGNLLASLFGFGPKEFFRSDPGAEKAPSVAF